MVPDPYELDPTKTIAVADCFVQGPTEAEFHEPRSTSTLAD
jgi:hypothetical protein